MTATEPLPAPPPEAAPPKVHFQDEATGYTWYFIVVLILAGLFWYGRRNWADPGWDRQQTQTQMAKAAEALRAYQADLGRFPYLGDAGAYDDNGFVGAEALLEPRGGGKNVLISSDVAGIANWQWLGLGSATYAQRWKGNYLGPYESYVFQDAWGRPLRYISYDQGLWLWSAGRDGTFEPGLDLVTASAFKGDDIATRVASLVGPGFVRGSAAGGLDRDLPLPRAGP